MVSDSLKQFFIFHAAVCDSKPDMYQFRIGAFNADKVTLFLLLKRSKSSKTLLTNISKIELNRLRRQRIPRPIKVALARLSSRCHYTMKSLLLGILQIRPFMRENGMNGAAEPIAAAITIIAEGTVVPVMPYLELPAFYALRGTGSMGSIAGSFAK